jgi:hypothetical protein
MKFRHHYFFLLWSRSGCTNGVVPTPAGGREVVVSGVKTDEADGQLVPFTISSTAVIATLPTGVLSSGHVQILVPSPPVKPCTEFQRWDLTGKKTSPHFREPQWYDQVHKDAMPLATENGQGVRIMNIEQELIPHIASGFEEKLLMRFHRGTLFKRLRGVINFALPGGTLRWINNDHWRIGKKNVLVALVPPNDCLLTARDTNGSPHGRRLACDELTKMFCEDCSCDGRRIFSDALLRDIVDFHATDWCCDRDSMGSYSYFKAGEVAGPLQDPDVNYCVLPGGSVACAGEGWSRGRFQCVSGAIESGAHCARDLCKAIHNYGWHRPSH